MSLHALRAVGLMLIAIVSLAGGAPSAHAGVARWVEQCGYGALGSGTTSWAVELNQPNVVGGQRAPRERVQLRVDAPQAVVDRLAERGGTDWEIEAVVELRLDAPSGMQLTFQVPVRLQREGSSLQRLSGDGQLPAATYPLPYYGTWTYSTWVITGDVRAVAPGGALVIGSAIDEDGDALTGDMRCSGPATERTLASFESTPAPATLHTPKPTRMISLGDSYSSGEGRDSSLYDCGTDLGGYNVPLDSKWTLEYHQGTTARFGVPEWGGSCVTPNGETAAPPGWYLRSKADYLNLCHRGGWAYPVQLRKALGVSDANGRSYACSAASTPQVIDSPQFPESPFGVTGGNTQLADALTFAEARGRPDLVTIGIGGNDASFGDVVADLVLHCGGIESCLEKPGWSSGRLARAEQFAYKRLIWAFAQLRDEFGEGSDPATIVAFGYPQVIGNVDSSCLATAGINRAERVWVKNEFLPAVNRAVRDAATVAGIAYVDLSAATAGHELCTSDPAFHGIGIAHESVHPNERGHELISAWLTSAGGPVNADLSLDLGNPAPVPEAEVARPPAPARSAHTGELEAPPAPPADPGDACIGARPRPANGCDLRVRGAGYAPNSQANLTLQRGGSSGSGFAAASASGAGDTDLGTVDVDAGGSFDVTRRLPGELPAGDYTLLLTGTAPDEQPQYGRLEFPLTEVGTQDPEPTTPPDPTPPPTTPPNPTTPEPPTYPTTPAPTTPPDPTPPPTTPEPPTYPTTPPPEPPPAPTTPPTYPTTPEPPTYPTTPGEPTYPTTPAPTTPTGPTSPEEPEGPEGPPTEQPQNPGDPGPADPTGPIAGGDGQPATGAGLPPAPGSELGAIGPLPPALTLALKSSKWKLTTRRPRSLNTTLITDAPSSVAATLTLTPKQARRLGLRVPRKAKTVTIATGHLATGPAGARSLKLSFTKAARTALARLGKRGKLNATLTTTATGATPGQPPSTQRFTVTLRR